jgi:hypothetical protein
MFDGTIPLTRAPGVRSSRRTVEAEVDVNSAQPLRLGTVHRSGLDTSCLAPSGATRRRSRAVLHEVPKACAIEASVRGSRNLEALLVRHGVTVR